VRHQPRTGRLQCRAARVTGITRTGTLALKTTPTLTYACSHACSHACLLAWQLCEAIIADESIIDIRKARICAQLGEADYCLSDGADEFLQLLRVGSSTMGCLCGPV